MQLNSGATDTISKYIIGTMCCYFLFLIACAKDAHKASLTCTALAWHHCDVVVF